MPAPSQRSTFKTHPSMGLPPRWCVGDLPVSYSTPVDMVVNVNVPTTSNPYDAQANSAELWTSFSDGATSCDILVLNDDGTGNFVQVAQFLGVNLFKDGNLFVGQLDQGITLEGRAIKVTVQNFQGNTGGTVSVRCSRLN